MKSKDYFEYDFKASVVVFLVALPLCLGIALASGAPLFAGLTAGIVGGIVAGFLSGSPLSVSGPAAGLTTIVALAIMKLASYEAFLLSVVIAGMIQIVLGFVRAGSIGHFFPASVVKGMLAAIGLILILKQVPHAAGYDIDFEGDENFVQSDGRNTFSELLELLQSLTPGAIAISLVALLILYLWERPSFKKYKFLELLPAPLIVVLVGILLNGIFVRYLPGMALEEKHLVSVPLLSDIQNGSSFITLPDFSVWKDSRIYIVAVTIAIVASL